MVFIISLMGWLVFVFESHSSFTPNECPLYDTYEIHFRPVNRNFILYYFVYFNFLEKRSHTHGEVSLNLLYLP